MPVKNINLSEVKEKIDQKILNPVSEILEKNPPRVQVMVKKIVEKAVEDCFGVEKTAKIPVKIEHPKIENYGDYSTNIAMILAGQLRIKPIDIADKINRKIDEYIRVGQSISYMTDSNSQNPITLSVDDVLENVKRELPGFINLWLSKKYLITQMTSLPETGKPDKSGKKTQLPLQNFLSNCKVMVEFTDPNPFKEFHIGHLYSNSVGESLSRLFEALGAQVKRANYFGDVGMHVAKTLYGVLANIKYQISNIKKIEDLPLKKRIRFLGQAYALGSKAYEEDEKAKKEITRINYLIFISAQEYLKQTKDWKPQADYQQYIDVNKKELEEISMLFSHGREWSLTYFESLFTRLGSRFDFNYPESIVGEYGMKLVKDSLKKGIFEESDGAVIFRGEKYGLHTRVFINKLGLPTYEAKELGLAPAKYRDFPYDFSLIVTGKEIDVYFQVLLKALSLIDDKLASRTKHLGHGMVRLPKGKMSSRTGEVLTGEWLLDTVKEKVLGIIEHNNSDYSKSEQEDIAEKGAVAAVKYSLLKVGLPSDITFDIDKSVSIEGDSGPYLMYTYARCKSVQRKFKTQNSNVKAKSQISNPDNFKNISLNEEERELLRAFYRFEEVVLEAVKNLSPSLLCTYLFELAQKYNLFYQKHTILGKSEKGKVKSKNYNSKIKSDQTEEGKSTWEDTKIFRLELTEATARIIRNGLYLLGIETVERM